MFGLANPEYLLLLPLIALAGWRVYARRRRSGLVFSPTSRLAAIAHTWRTRVSSILPALVLVGLILLVIALARPRTTLARRFRKSEVIAIEMVVDVSGSMRALDMSDIVGRKITKERTRLDAVKKAFGEFVKKRPGDLIGLVTFGGFASTRAPLTLDHNALLHVLDGVEIPSETYDGRSGVVNREELMTAIGDGLATACARINSAEPESKIIVLLSDGESNTGIVQPEEAIEVAKALKIKVYTIGVGSSGMAPMKVQDAYGRESIVPSRVVLDEAMLRKIAASTGGSYFNVLDTEGLEEAMKEIEELEKTDIERQMYEEHRELFLWALVPGLCLVVAGTGLNVMITRRIV